MAEVKNAFIKSKMNKDLDDRLIPSGEYRDGLNIQVSKSEGQDVGALENVLGNEIALDASQPPNNVDFSVLSNCGCSLTSIGTYVDNSNSIVYIFLTDYTDNTIGNFTYNKSANNFIYSYNTNTNQVIKLVEGSFLNFSTKNPIYGVNLVENLLFWTDNRNQPRKINISLANNGLFYTTEDKISVAKYNPYQCINLYYEDEAATTPIGDVNPNKDKFVTSMQDVTSALLPDGTTKNPYYNPQWPGDPDFLEDKFVRFSYRFKFVDGEYSILAPFTQDCFIPKQDGYFIDDDESAAYRSTIVNFMENKVNNIILNIPLPYAAGVLYNNLNIEEIEIVYKESNALAVKVLDTILRNDFQGTTSAPSTNLYYNYDYQSRKPYRTLPDSEITRVYDKVPVRAFSQEIISNRVVYGNFQTKHTPPESLDYDVAISPKLDFLGPETGSGVNPAVWYTSIVEYPEHTVKQNRNYQVGFILSDRYGRSSTTILSSINDIIKTSGGLIFGGSTYYHPYRKATDINSALWPGDSIKVLLNKRVESFKDLQQGTPGLYNGDISSSDYNPLGWYSYKIVVKQTEQDYYNTYLPGILNGYPSSLVTPDPFPTNEDGKTAHIVLLNDNINKIPRDLSEVGPDQKQYRSSVQLYGRVNNNTATTNNQYYPGIETNTVSTIANAIDLDMSIDATTGLDTDGKANLYQISTNPIIGRVSTLEAIGTLNTTGAANMVPKLAVYETKPVESALDIFWESSTSGTINDLNISLGAVDQIDDLVDFEFTQTEATGIGTSVAGDFYPVRVIGQINPVTVTDSSINVWSVTDQDGNTVTDYWDLETQTGGQFVFYKLKPKKILYYDTNLNLNQFTFRFEVIDNTIATKPSFIIVKSGTLANIAPTITTTPLSLTLPLGTTNITTFTAVNGCGDTLQNNKDLIWNLEKATLTNSTTVVTDISLNPETGELTSPNGTLNGSISCIIEVEDSGNEKNVITFNLLIGTEPLNEGFGQSNSVLLSPVTISTGAESASIFWQSGTVTPSVNTPSPFNDPYGVGDSTWNTSTLSSSKVESTPVESNSEIYYSDPNNIGEIKKYSPSQYYKYKNTYYRPDYFKTNITPNALTTGTAFITVECEFTQQPYYNESTPYAPSGPIAPVVGWPVILQYRANSNDNWVTATDVEGSPIRFGGLAYSQYDGIPTPTDPNVDPKYYNYKTTGIIQNSSTGTSIYPAQGTNFGNGEDIMALQVDQPFSPTIKGTTATATSAPISGKIQKTFVFGTDQGYKQNTRLGEYRLFITYPYSVNSDSLVGGPALGSTQIYGNTSRRKGAWNYSQSIPNDTVTGKDENLKVSVAFGDFYYSNGEELGGQTTAYQYRITQAGASTRTAAKDLDFETKTSINGPADVVVYAAEWACKYITKFYTDEKMTTQWIPSANNYFYAYAPVSPGIMTEYGTNYSAPKSGLTNPSSFDSRWTAQFEINGDKVMGSSEPNVE
mgnify:CR=1 FL=1|tara:strand:- start:5898 stop:10301 length:4404 start_codon:yes stop_codon:yes gene_type:complete